MKKYILIFALLLPIIFYFTPDISAQTTDLNQKAACNSKRNGDSCTYQEISGSRGQTNNTSKQGFCDRINGGSNANSNTLICKSGNEADSWEDCVVVGDKCKDKASKKEGQCITKTTGSGRGTLTQIVCNASGAPTTSCVTNAERDDKCGTGNKCTGGQVCANIDNTVKCVTNAERDNKCGTGNKCTGNQVCVTQSAKVDTASTGTPSSSSSSSSATTTAGTVTYQSYTNFPGVGRISDLCQLITALWYLGFAVLLTSVLGMFLWGGYIYVTAGVNAGKVNQAKEIFTNTITGLIIGLSIFIIINIINPGLLQGNCSIPPIGSTGTGPVQPTLGGEGGGAGIDGTGDLKNLTFACVGTCTCAAQNNGTWAEGLDGDGQGDAKKCIVDAMKYVAAQCPGSRVNAFNETCGHSSGSAHYDGRAVDFNEPFCGASLSSCTSKQQNVINTLKSKGYKVGTPGGVCGASFPDSAGHIHIGC